MTISTFTNSSHPREYLSFKDVAVSLPDCQKIRFFVFEEDGSTNEIPDFQKMVPVLLSSPAVVLPDPPPVDKEATADIGEIFIPKGTLFTVDSVPMSHSWAAAVLTQVLTEALVSHAEKVLAEASSD